MITSAVTVRKAAYLRFALSKAGGFVFHILTFKSGLNIKANRKKKDKEVFFRSLFSFLPPKAWATQLTGRREQDFDEARFIKGLA